MTADTEPSALLKRVAMPGWVEMRLTKINLRTDAAKKFAACTLDHWKGTPEKSQPQTVVKPRAVAVHDSASQLLGSCTAWTIAAVTVSLGAILFDFEIEDFLVLMVWVAWLIVFVGSWLLREVTKASALEYRRQVKAAKQAAMRRDAPQLSDAEMDSLAKILSTTEGKLAYAAAVLAAETESSPVWGDPVFDDFHARVDLHRHVGEIADSARALDRARKKLGSRPGGALAKDEAVTELYERRVREFDERLAGLTQRVHGLLVYRDHVHGFEPLIEKRKWLEKHRYDQVDSGSVFDELGSAELRSATDEIDSRTREAMNFLLEDAERLSKL
ncbi:hypothetical protein [Rhodococcus tukisamuensis]|uniref:Uncharacterized protein n=1 Tax=Rhodococcus tukisamuensis TaxID=168276 RepID=A0A1G6MNI5_9NOCA|nr:hypothetical protein [Rhodococcus tukisamuensis]SDC57089.1 hypothetical protein SAMN05444580_101248 [Rhodococcus tukisamuensis]